MNTGTVSATLSQEFVDKIKAAINVILTELPFLLNLPENQSKGLFRLGPKSLDFVSTSRDAVTHFMQILPSTFNQTEFLKDADLFRQLAEIKFLLDSLLERINDTYSVVGAEAMDSALEVYAYVQVNQNKVPGLKTVAEKLGERFKKTKSSKGDQA